MKKMHPLKYLFLLVFISPSTWTISQNMHFSGTVNDGASNAPVQHAVVMAVRLSDARLLGFTRTDRYGRFELTSVPIDTMELVITHPNFDDKRYYIIGSEENNRIDIPNIAMPDKATELEEVVVYANKEPIYFRGDTLVYVADSFARKENAVVEDLLKNLPGIDVDKDGRVSSQGREVTKVLVDGDEFFGADPTIATRNLMADGVETIEIYETEDETAGGNTEEKIQVMDVRLKDDAKRGYFGKLAGAGGGNPEYFQNLPDGQGFYEGEFLANYFDRDLKVSVFGLGSNTPNTGFSYQDASRFGLTNEMNTGWQSRISGQSNTQQGLPTSYKGGFYYSQNLNKNSKLGVNYTYNSSALLVNEDRNSEYFLSDTTYSSLDSRINDQLQNAHTVNLNFEHKIDSLTRLEVVGNVTQRNEFLENDKLTEFYTPAGVLSNQTTVNNSSEAQGLEANANIKLVRNFNKRNRKFIAEYQYGYSENDRENFLLSEISNFILPIPDSTFDQRRDINNKTIGHRGIIDYTEPLTRKLKFNVQYRADYFIGDQSNYTFDGANGIYDQFAPQFSNDFSTSRFENRGGASIIYTGRKQTINAGSRVRNVRIDNLNNFTDDVFVQNVFDVLPFMEYTYKFSNAHRFRFNYTTRSDQPSLNQLQPVRDNTNPNNLVVGNPDLVPNYVHSINGFYNKWNAIEQSYVWASFFGTATNNAFANSITYLPDGRTVSRAINVDGNYFGGLYFGGGIPLFNKFLRLDPNANITYSRFNQEIVDFSSGTGLTPQMNVTESFNYTGGLNLSVRNDTIEVSLGVDFTYSDPRSSLSTVANQPFTTETYKLDVFYELPFRMFVETDIRYIVNRGRADGFDIAPFIWNAKINKRFTKTGNLIVSLSAFDLLNQNIGINRQIMNNVIIDYRTQIIARYFMGGISYRFNNNKTKEDEGRSRWF